MSRIPVAETAFSNKHRFGFRFWRLFQLMIGDRGIIIL